ncbi:MAG: acetoacetate--CoA ligase [Acidimicrobiaceae bacterium]|nr:acetoacetate--CoA ligase [Acidimicrobiaceae bacterium]
MSQLWEPSERKINESRLMSFASTAEPLFNVDLPDYDAVHKWSIESPDQFWRHAWSDLGLIGEMGDRTLVTGENLQESVLFPDATLNIAENFLKRNDDTEAIIWVDELGNTFKLTWAELNDQVSLLQQALLDLGVGNGDCVAAWLPNRPETISVMIAAASIGAVFTSTSPDFGVTGLLDRFTQAKPKILFATDGYFYGGKWFSCLEKLEKVESGLPSLQQTIIVPYQTRKDMTHDAIVGNSQLIWEDFIRAYSPKSINFPPHSFNHPWYILYSSGTTGKPKCIVHRTGGVLLKHLVEHRLQCDVKIGDRVFYYTTAGWMMWNWLVSALASEATVVLYDGSPFHPSPTSLFDLADEQSVTLLGISAKYVDACAKAGLAPMQTHDLSSIRTICSTGSTLVGESFDYVYRDIKKDVHLQSMSGGTDLCGCLVAGDPTGPVHRGEIQKPALGVNIEILNDTGKQLGHSEQGELVCSSPFPSMPLEFLNDETGEKYSSAYFNRYEKKWHQGDFAEWTPTGGVVIHGRSDATLNPGGVRIGTAEIYSVVDALEEISESVAITQEWDGDNRIVLFVITSGTNDFNTALEEKIKKALRDKASPRHVPAIIIPVLDLPRTRSGKLSELAVKAVVKGTTVRNAEALANPEALDYFKDLKELQ